MTDETSDVRAPDVPEPDATAMGVAPTAPRKHERLPWVVGGVALALVLLVAGITVPLALAQQRHAAAEARYAAASAAYTTALGDAEEGFGVFQSAQESALGSRALADEVIAVADPAYVDPAALEALTETMLSLTEALEAADTAPEQPRPLGAAPEDTEALTAQAEEIAAQVDDVRAAGEAYAELAAGIEGALAPVDAAGAAFMAGLPAAAASVDAAFISAANPARIEYRRVTESLDGVEWVPGAGERVGRYVAAAGLLSASHAAEEAQKAGPLYANRRAAEDFARSIAGGVMLDFDWAPIVNGYGANGSYGGTATWNTAHGGYSTITLSDSVAAMWHSNPAVASLVAHEVGHSITGKCMTLFTEGFGSQAEVFATAWAIGMGFDRDGSGESIYGRPGDDLIELSKECR